MHEKQANSVAKLQIFNLNKPGKRTRTATLVGM